MKTINRKPNVFIGCSREAIDYARAVSSSLERICQVNPWYAGTFGANDYTMEALERELDVNDFGVFVFAADDVALIRNKPVFITRDNTLFEMGLFWGRLGRRRVFAIIPRDLEQNKTIDGKPVDEFHVLSDLSGLTLLNYGIRSDDKFVAAVDTACGEIMKAIEKEGLFINPKNQLTGLQDVLDRKQSIIHFFWEYSKNVTITDQAERYSAFCEAIRSSLLVPYGIRIGGAAIWKKIDDEHIGQVGGNVGKGRTFHIQENDEKSGTDQRIYVLDTFKTGTWSFLHRREIADVYILCYPLGKDHVLSVHILSNGTLSDEQLAEIVDVNDELLVDISYMVGGNSK